MPCPNMLAVIGAMSRLALAGTSRDVLAAFIALHTDREAERGELGWEVWCS